MDNSLSSVVLATNIIHVIIIYYNLFNYADTYELAGVYARFADQHHQQHI